MAPVLKTGVVERLPGVRIPPPPPRTFGPLAAEEGSVLGRARLRRLLFCANPVAGLRRPEYHHVLSHIKTHMATTERVTVSLPLDLVEDIDRFERNRSRFITAAVEHELLRRRREGLLRSVAREPARGSW